MFRKINLLAAVAVVSLVSLSSCSGDGGDRRAELVAQLPDGAALYGAFDPMAVFSSAGARVEGGEVVLPRQLRRIADDDDDVVSAALRLATARGLDYRSMAFSAGDNDAVLLFSLADAGKFDDWAIEEGYDGGKSGGYRIYSKEIEDSRCAIVVDGDVAWIVGGVRSLSEAVRRVDAYKTEAARRPVPEWKAERLTAGDAALLVDAKAVGGSSGQKDLLPMSVPSGAHMCVDFSFDGPALLFHGEALDDDGDVVGMLPEGSSAAISSEALSVIKDSQAVLAFPLFSGWRDILAPFAGYSGDAVYDQLAAIRSIGIGVTVGPDANLLTFSFDDIEATVVAECDKDSADAVVDRLVSLAGDALGSGRRPARRLDGSVYEIAPYPFLPGLKFYAAGRGDLVVMSTTVDRCRTKPKADKHLDGMIGYIDVDLERSHPLLRLVGCPFGVRAEMASYPDRTDGKIELTDCEGGFIENWINFVSRL